MMQSGEDVIHGVHGTPIAGRQRPGADTVRAELDTLRSRAALVEAERLIELDEPYYIDDSILKEEDATVQAYMEVHDHYHSAYNAVARRNSTDLYVAWILDMAEAIMGHPVAYDVNENDPPVTRLIWEAGQERSRLTAQIERNTETLAVQADSVASQQRLIHEMSRQSSRGKAAFDAMMLLGVQLGIQPVPTEAEEFFKAVRQAFIREENERDAALSELRDLCEYAGGGREGTAKELAAHIRGAISV